MKLLKLAKLLENFDRTIMFISSMLNEYHHKKEVF
jgi:hypothetical protein